MRVCALMELIQSASRLPFLLLCFSLSPLACTNWYQSHSLAMAPEIRSSDQLSDAGQLLDSRSAMDASRQLTICCTVLIMTVLCSPTVTTIAGLQVSFTPSSEAPLLSDSTFAPPTFAFTPSPTAWDLQDHSLSSYTARLAPISSHLGFQELSPAAPSRSDSTYSMVSKLEVAEAHTPSSATHYLRDQAFVSHSEPLSYLSFFPNAIDLPPEGCYDYVAVGWPFASSLSQKYRVLVLKRDGFFSHEEPELRKFRCCPLSDLTMAAVQTVEGRNLLSVDYENVIGGRCAFRHIKLSHSTPLAISTICAPGCCLTVTSDSINGNSSTAADVLEAALNIAVFKITTCSVLKKLSVLSSEFAQDIANTELPPIHLIGLGLALNFSVFSYEILHSPARTYNLATQAFDDQAFYGWPTHIINFEIPSPCGFDAYPSVSTMSHANLTSMKDTEQFQGLRDVKQIGLTPDVTYSYASHKAVNEYKEAKALGMETVPVLGLTHMVHSGATAVIFGLALGYKSVIIPIFAIAVRIFVSLSLAAVYGFAVAALGMLRTMATRLAIDAYGPISDNDGGITERAGRSHRVREGTDALDAARNTTATIGKGFAIGSAVLLSLALFGAFVSRAANSTVNVLIPKVFIGLLVGAMLLYWFSAMTMKIVGSAALKIFAEAHRQFNAIPGLLEGTGTPDHATGVKISTDASVRGMIPLGALVMFTPLVVGVFLV